MNHMNALQQQIDDYRRLLGIQCEQREIWLENGALKPGSFKQSDSGLHLLDLEYRLVLAIERLHNDQAGLLILLVYQFSTTVDREGLEDISFSVDSNDEHTVDVEFSMGVREPVYVVPVDNSPIIFDGQQWGFGDGSINVAEVLAGVTVERKS